MMELYSLDKWTETSERLLASIADDTDTYLQKVRLCIYIRSIFRSRMSISSNPLSFSDAKQLS